MRNIFFFVRHYFNLLFFLLLQGFCIYLIVHYNSYHNAIFSATANQITGKINEQYNRAEDYLHLKKTNDSLWKANEKLYNKLKADFQLPDTVSKQVVDSIKLDSLTHYRKYNYMHAAVIENLVNTPSNFIVLNRGKKGNLKKDMGVVDINEAVIGIVTDVSDDYAIVMSLLHKDSHIEGMLFRGNGETGTLNWDGKTPNIIAISHIPKTAKVAIGDTIISSGNSTSIPKGKLLGYVTEVIPEKNTTNLLIKFKTAANFYNLQYAYAIDNSQQETINQLLDKAKQKNK